MTDRDDALRLFGTDEPVPELRVFRAGGLHCEFAGGGVRRVLWHGEELLRGVSYLLRDRDWGTAPCHLDDLTVDESPARFTLQFVLRMPLGDAQLRAQASIEGRADGHFSFTVDAAPDREIVSSRCGFVVLHPASCAGRALAVVHTDGSVEHTAFPQAISPGQPVFDIRAMQWSLQPGLAVGCRLWADLPGLPGAKFEMEDQRNWSDASFKTYVGSLLDPWPYAVPAGAALRQAVTVTVQDSRDAAARAVGAGRAVEPLRWSPLAGLTMPPLGLGMPHLDVMPTAAEQAAVAALRPAWLVVQLELARANGPAQLSAARELAAISGAAVQIDVICPDDLPPAQVAERVRQACHAADLAPAALRLCPRAYLASYQPTDRWPDVAPLEDYARAARAAFPSARIGGGMITNFTELNRKRQSAEAIQFIGHTSCPIVHAADERSVMETLEALPAMAHTVREVWPGLGWRIGPLALAAARNPYGSATAPNPGGRRLCLADRDPRHHGQFGAAWCAGVAAVLAPLGVELLALWNSHGPSGPLLADSQPGWAAGATVPAWPVLCELAAWRGRALWACDGLPPGVRAVASRAGDGALRALVVNTAEPPVELVFDTAMSMHAPGGATTAPRHRVRLGAYEVAVLSG